MRGNSATVPTVIAIAAVALSLVAIVISMQDTGKVSASENLQIATPSHYSGEKKEFWLFNSDIPNFNEDKMGMPHDVYSMPTIAVFKGDHVVIHFYNTEEAGGDNHSFTINDRPYKINTVLNPGQNTTITFEANATGTFSYYCIFHQPTMRGQLLVQPPPY